MKQQLFSLIVFTGTLLFACSAFAADSNPDVTGGTEASVSGTGLTPVRGSSERKAVLDVLRQEVKRLHGMDVIFVVRHLKVKNGWAWAHTQPQSPDGSQQYEDILALLNSQDGSWKVVELPCTEVENPDCIDAPEYFSGLKERFPGVPAEIFLE